MISSEKYFEDRENRKFVSSTPLPFSELNKLSYEEFNLVMDVLNKDLELRKLEEFRLQ